MKSDLQIIKDECARYDDCNGCRFADCCLPSDDGRYDIAADWITEEMDAVVKKIRDEDKKNILCPVCHSEIKVGCCSNGYVYGCCFNDECWVNETNEFETTDALREALKPKKNSYGNTAVGCTSVNYNSIAQETSDIGNCVLCGEMVTGATFTRGGGYRYICKQCASYKWTDQDMISFTHYRHNYDYCDKDTGEYLEQWKCKRGSK